MKDGQDRLGLIYQFSKIPGNPGEPEFEAQKKSRDELRTDSSIDVIDYAIKNNIQMGRLNSREAILFAIDKKILIKGKDPVIYAIENNILIENTSAREWAAQNYFFKGFGIEDLYDQKEGESIDEPKISSPSKIFTRNEIIDKFTEIGEELTNEQMLAFTEDTAKDPVAFAVENQILIDDILPLDWARKNNYKINFKQIADSISTKEQMEKSVKFAIENGSLLWGADPVVLAVINNISIGNTSLLEWAEENNYKINNKELALSIDRIATSVSADDRTSIQKSIVDYYQENPELIKELSDILAKDSKNAKIPDKEKNELATAYKAIVNAVTLGREDVINKFRGAPKDFTEKNLSDLRKDVTKNLITFAIENQIMMIDYGNGGKIVSPLKWAEQNDYKVDDKEMLLALAKNGDFCQEDLKDFIEAHPDLVVSVLKENLNSLNKSNYKECKRIHDNIVGIVAYNNITEILGDTGNNRMSEEDAREFEKLSIKQALEGLKKGGHINAKSNMSDAEIEKIADGLLFNSFDTVVQFSKLGQAIDQSLKNSSIYNAIVSLVRGVGAIFQGKVDAKTIVSQALEGQGLSADDHKRPKDGAAAEKSEGASKSFQNAVRSKGSGIESFAKHVVDSKSNDGPAK